MRSNLNVIIKRKIELDTLNIGCVLRRPRPIRSNISVKYFCQILGIKKSEPKLAF